ncbi:MAG: hypothetical protein KF796_01330 [Ramlibacter sp.]|nr:hypothetical protein [Ramlibacter sp.]
MGAWVGCNAFSPTESDRETFTFAKQSDTTLTYTYAATRFANTVCTGAGSVQPGEQGVVSLDAGTKAVQGETADKVTFQITQPAPASGKQVLAITAANAFRIGQNSGAKDAQGYPSTFRSVAYQKQ